MPSTFDRYTEEARTAVFFARLEAVHRDEEFIRAKDILLGLTWDQSSRADRIGSLKEHAVELRAEVSVPHLPSTAFPYLRKKDVPLDDDAKKILAYASNEADRDRQFWIDTDHLLRGILSFQNRAAEALERRGMTLEMIRSASVSDRLDHPSRSTPKWVAFCILLNRHRNILLLLVFLLSLVLLVKIMGPA